MQPAFFHQYGAWQEQTTGAKKTMGWGDHLTFLAMGFWFQPCNTVYQLYGAESTERVQFTNAQNLLENNTLLMFYFSWLCFPGFFVVKSNVK